MTYDEPIRTTFMKKIMLMKLNYLQSKIRSVFAYSNETFETCNRHLFIQAICI